MSALLFSGRVMHYRVRPTTHRFNYGVFFIRFSLDRLEALQGPLFSLNGPNLFSLRVADYGPRDGSDLRPWIRALLTREGLPFADGEIWLQTFPRVLGYAFNPVSFWLCHDRAGALRAVLAEVNNTFGEHHHYLLSHRDGRPITAGDEFVARKVFHVSPFFDVRGTYRFRFRADPADSLFRIDYEEGSGKLLYTTISGRAESLSSRALALAFARRPFMTLGVIARIHYQALRLWLKRVNFFRKPVPPACELTRSEPESDPSL
ncbi:MAG: DUF1365 domain-containing protein [Burkholderiales bacterium]|nr:DUF1365 domain-containing protein [Burkholderiales bacterium]